MKGLADRLQIVMFDIRMAHDETFLLALINDRQHAVVRRYEILILSADQQWPPLGSYTWIDNHDVDGFRRKIGIRGANRQRAIEQIKRRDVVRDVHNGYVGIDLQDYALQRSHQMVAGPVVCCECDDRVSQWILSAGIICAGAPTECYSTPHPLTLSEARAPVKNSRGNCCAIANGLIGQNSGANQPTPCSGAQECQSGSGK